MMRIPSGKTDIYLHFTAESTTGGPKTGLTSFTVYRARNGGSLTLWTTPTTVEFSSSNAPGEYALLIDEDTTIASTSDSEMMTLYITATGMVPVREKIELYRRTVTSGQTLTSTSGGVTLADGVSHGGTLGSSTATLALSRASIVSQSSNTTALTVTGNGTGVGLAANGGASGHGASFAGGATSGSGLKATSTAGNGSGLDLLGHGSGHGIKAMGGGTTGSGIHATANTAATGDADGLSCVGSKDGGGITAHGGRDMGSGTGNGPGIYCSNEGAGYAFQAYAGPLAFGAMLIDAGGGPTDCTGLDIRGKGGWSGCKISSAGGQALEITGHWGIGVYSTDHALEIISSSADAIYAEANGVDKYAINLNSNDSTLLNPMQTTEIAAGVLTTQMTESYAVDGVAPTLTQSTLAIQQYLLDRSVSGTAMTIYKLDGTTPALETTLDSSTVPTIVHRTS